MAQLVSMVVAVVGGLLAGVSVHLISRALRLEFTMPGALLATAVCSVLLSYVRWRL